MCLIFQRYKFKSKSQQLAIRLDLPARCVWYSKGTNLKANHNLLVHSKFVKVMCLIFQRYKFKSKSQRIKIFTSIKSWCVWYSKGTNLKANHNRKCLVTVLHLMCLIFQRYKFKSKSQLNQKYIVVVLRCVWYSKGTNLKANHNSCCSLR